MNRPVVGWLIGLAVALLILFGPTLVLGTEMPDKCAIVLGDADHALIPSGWQYAGAGVWTDPAGTVVGHSGEEDSIIYTTAHCAALRPLYQPTTRTTK